MAPFLNVGGGPDGKVDGNEIAGADVVGGGPDGNVDGNEITGADIVGGGPNLFAAITVLAPFLNVGGGPDGNEITDAADIVGGEPDGNEISFLGGGIVDGGNDVILASGGNP